VRSADQAKAIAARVEGLERGAVAFSDVPDDLALYTLK
jgi:hypothetical protein